MMYQEPKCKGRYYRINYTSERRDAKGLWLRNGNESINMSVLEMTNKIYDIHGNEYG